MTSESSRPRSSADLEIGHLTEVRVLSCALESLAASQRSTRMIAGIRGLRLPFLAAKPEIATDRVITSTFDAHFALGTVEFPTTLALAGHCAAAIALLRTVDDDDASPARQRFASRLEDRRMLLVDAIDPTDGVVRCVTEAGIPRVAGSRPLIPFADLGDVLLIAVDAPESGMMVLPVELRRNPRLAFGPAVQLDTTSSVHLRTVLLRGIPLEEKDLLFSLDGVRAKRFLLARRALRESFRTASLLGATQRALEETRASLLRRRDRERIELTFGRSIVRERAAALTAFEARDRLAAALASPNRSLELERAAIATSTALEEADRAFSEITLACLRLVGKDAFSTHPALIRISQHLSLRALDEQPETTTDLEAGRDFLRRAE